MGLSDGYKTKARRTLMEYKQFCASVPPETPEGVTLGAFIIGMAIQGSLAPTSLQTYLSAFRKLMPASLFETTAVRGALRLLGKMRAKYRGKQAKPMKPEQVEQLALEMGLGADVLAAIRLAFGGMARLSCVQQWRTDDMVLHPEKGLVEVYQRSDKVGWFNHHRAMRVSADDMRYLQKVQQTSPQGSLVFPRVTYGRVSTALKRVDPELSAHSPRRGSATQLGRRHSAEDIALLSGHRPPGSVGSVGSRQYIDHGIVSMEAQKQIQMTTELQDAITHQKEMGLNFCA